MNDIEKARSRRVVAKLKAEFGPLDFERVASSIDAVVSVSPEIIADGIRERPEIQASIRNMAAFYNKIVEKLDEQKG